MNFPSTLLIDNERVRSSSGKPDRLTNPATGQVFAEIESASDADVERAITGAERAFENGWRDLAPGRRAEILFRVAALLRANLEELARMESLNVGKPIADARDEA